MPTIATSQLPIPKDWNEFEDICADLFSLIWNDHNTVRYGRAGQRQNDVDIRGQSPRGGIAGVQCKGKRQWPPVKLTTAEIDAEVAKALDFQPPLSEFTIATTALNDGPLQAHVDAITERHRAQGLFSVHLLGWDELCRRITNYDQLVEKHFGLITLSSVRRDIEAVPRLVADNLCELGLVAVPAHQQRDEAERGDTRRARGIPKRHEKPKREGDRNSVSLALLIDLVNPFLARVVKRGRARSGLGTKPRFRRLQAFPRRRQALLRSCPRRHPTPILEQSAAFL